MVLAVAAFFLQASFLSPAGPAGGSDAKVDTKPVMVSSAPAPVTARSTEELPNAPEPTDKTSSSSIKTVAFNTSDGSQNSQSLSTVRIPGITPSKQPDITPAERLPRRSWLALSLIQHGAAGFDAYSTRYAVGHGAVERDPLMRPFANSPSIYAASQVCPLVLDIVARRMQRSENGMVRHMWWLPQSVSTATFLFSGMHNIHVANQP
ncbi:MAG TPA: hypothetical protein VLY23_14895 [Candidatus Acidoferrum sp.]|nr:hypothetical protein [Candidatus Acidoferrum sp.]